MRTASPFSPVKFTTGRVSVYSTVWSGFSAAYGSWKIICTFLCRFRMPFRFSWATSRSPKRTAPEVGFSMPVMSFAIVDLPEPEAPTSASDWPGSSVNDTSSTAVTADSPRRGGG